LARPSSASRMLRGFTSLYSRRMVLRGISQSISVRTSLQA
jgi:hypothetical protein